MNVNFLNPFIDAAVDVLKAEVKLTLNRGNLQLEESALTSNDVTILIHLVGEVYGVVLYSMPVETGLRMVSAMMGQEFTELNSLAQSGIAELGNVITGRATIKLFQSGYQSNISPPAVIVGKGLKISTLDFPRIVIPFSTTMGEFVIHLALREQKPGDQVVPEDFVHLTVR